MSEKLIEENVSKNINEELKPYEDDIKFIKSKLETFTPLTEEKINKIVDNKILNMGVEKENQKTVKPFDEFKELMDQHIKTSNSK